MGEELRELQEEMEEQQYLQQEAISRGSGRSEHSSEIAKVFLEEDKKKRKRKHGDDGEESDEEKAAGSKKPLGLSPPRTESKGSGSSDGLMTEAEAQALMRKNKTTDVKRGTTHAAERIKREMAEWEQSKAKNPEFWKPPKFCLVLGSGRR